jgi:hypothetical protein
MSRLSIELTSKQHQQVKAVAALKGQSIKDHVLERVLAPLDNNQFDTEQDLKPLEGLLHARVKEAESGKLINQSVESIFSQVKDETAQAAP